MHSKTQLMYPECEKYFILFIPFLLMFNTSTISMQHKIFFFLGQYFIFCTRFHLTHSKALIGNNIRLANENEFSFVVSIMKRSNVVFDPRRNHVCAGSLISSEFVLTSEHCLSMEFLEGLYVHVGSNNLNHGNKYYIFWWISYDQWVTMRNTPIRFPANDIAVIRLLLRVPSEIRPANLSNGPNTNYYGLRVETVGWGIASNDMVNDLLQTVSLRVISHRECERRLYRLQGQRLLVESVQAMCSIATPYALLSWGDSGGPLLYQYNIVAINRGTCPHVAFGNSELVNFHIGINYYRDFILEIKNYSF